MNYYSTKLWVSYPNLTIPIVSQNKKKLCIFFYGENTNFFDTYNHLGIKKNIVRRAFIPYLTKPIQVNLSPEEKNIYSSYGLIPIKDSIGRYNRLVNQNFFFDTSKVMDVYYDRYKPKQFNSGRGLILSTSILSYLNTIDENVYEKLLLYTVDLTKPIDKRIYYKKFYPILNSLILLQNKKIEKLPFDKLFIFMFNGNDTRWIKLYDNELPNNNISRIKNFIIKLKSENTTEQEKQDIESIAQLAADETNIVDTEEDKELVKDAVKNYLKVNTLKLEDLEQNIEDHEEVDLNKNIEKDNHHQTIENLHKSKITDVLTAANNLVAKSVFYNVSGNSVLTNKFVKDIQNKSYEEKKEVVKNLTAKLLPKISAKVEPSNILNKIYNIPKLIDYVSPEHIIKKRQDDFNEFMLSDMIAAFKTLEHEDPPLKFIDIKVKDIETPINEIYKSLKRQYYVKLQDINGNYQINKIEFPRLTKDGMLVINGNNKVIINQLVKFPIFYSLDQSRLESSYSILKILSKKLRTSSYFIIFAGSFKVPLIEFLAYKAGFKTAMDKFNIKYTIIESKQQMKGTK